MFYRAILAGPAARATALKELEDRISLLGRPPSKFVTQYLWYEMGWAFRQRGRHHSSLPSIMICLSFSTWSLPIKFDNVFVARSKLPFTGGSSAKPGSY